MLKNNKILLLLVISIVFVIVSSSFALGFLDKWCEGWEDWEEDFGCHGEPQTQSKCDFCGGEWHGCYTAEGDDGCGTTEYYCCGSMICDSNHCCPSGEEWDDELGCIEPIPTQDCALENQKASTWGGTCCAKGDFGNPYTLYKCSNGYCQQCCNDGHCNTGEICSNWVCVDADCSPAGKCDTSARKICLSSLTWSDPDVSAYCNGCDHCGDGKCNCGESVNTPGAREDCCVDKDNDGWCKNGVNGASNEDCDDTSSSISPDDPEICFGNLDEDCDGDADCFDSQCSGAGPCKSCDIDEDCDSSPCYPGGVACVGTAPNKNCEYQGSPSCALDGYCCFPLCDFPGGPNPDMDCKSCPEPIEGDNNLHYLPVNAVAAGSLSFYVDNNDNVHYGSKQHSLFGIGMNNALAASNQCQYPVISRGFVVIDTSCIPVDAEVHGDVYFEFELDSLRAPQGSRLQNASLWIVDPSAFPGDYDWFNEVDWIVPSTYNNNPPYQVQLDIGRGYYKPEDSNYAGEDPIEYCENYPDRKFCWCYTKWGAQCTFKRSSEYGWGTNRVKIPKSALNLGGYTAFILRYGQAGTDTNQNWKSDKKYAQKLDNCNFNPGGNSCGDGANCACAPRAQGPKCSGDPCGSVTYLQTNNGNCVGCTQGGYVAKDNKHFCIDDGEMKGPIEVTTSSPVINISFCAPACNPACGQADGCGGTCPTDNRSTGYVNPCDTSDICYDTFGAAFGAPLRGTGSYNPCILAADIACGTEIGAQCLPPNTIDDDCDGFINCSDGDCAAQPACSGLVNICRDVYKTEPGVGDRYNMAWNADATDCDWCPSSNFCVYLGTCYTSTGLLGTGVPLAAGMDNQTLCNESSNKWGDIDGAQNACILAGFNWTIAGEPNVGEYGALNDGGNPAAGGNECCGDDTDEFLRVTTDMVGIDHIACCDNSTDCVDTTDTCRDGGAENCTNGIDDDCDGWIDGEDFQCPEGAGNETASPYRMCEDAVDNDAAAQPGRGFTDADDFKCQDFCTGINASTGKDLRFDASGGDTNFFGVGYSYNFSDWEDTANNFEYCCGDDPLEYYKNTTMNTAPTFVCNNSAQPEPCPYHACCNVTTDCIDGNGNCQIGSEDTIDLCIDGLDNDCDGLIDAFEPECTGVVWGFVYDKNMVPLPDALVKGSPLGPSAIFESMNTTNILGRYNIQNAFIGSYNFIGRKEGFDDNVTALTINPGSTQQVDFVLRNGSCHADCTDYYDNCNWDCEGLTFGAGEDCTFITTLCEGKPAGFKIRYYNATTGLNHEYTCCEGPERSYPRIRATVTGQPKNVYDMVLTVKGQGKETEIVHIIVWMPED